MLTTEQQKIRRKGIGGSEIAAVCGLNPWMKPIEVYLLKIGAAEPDESNHHMERGTYLEDGFIQWYAYRYKRKKIDKPGTLVHPKHPLVRATPDAVADDEYVVEIKAPHWRTADDWGEEDSEDIPDYYLPQVQWEMAVTGLKKADVVAFIDGNIRRFQVSFCEKLFGALLEEAEYFWRTYVEQRQPPPEDGSESYSEYLKTRFPRSVEPLIETDDPAVVQLVQEYRLADMRHAEAEIEKARARQAIEVRIGEHAGIRGAWGKITYKHNKDSVILDHAAIRAAFDAETLRHFEKPKPGPRVFRATFKR